jgi:hypothetical protein
VPRGGTCNSLATLMKKAHEVALVPTRGRECPHE